MKFLELFSKKFLMIQELLLPHLTYVQINDFMWGLSPSTRTFLKKNAFYFSIKRLENNQLLKMESASGFNFLRELCEKLRIDF